MGSFTSIRAAMLTLAATTFGATYHELAVVTDLAKNPARRRGYGVRPLSGSPASGAIRALTIDHVFELILTDTIARADSDADYQAAVDTMLDQGEAFARAAMNTKLGLAAIVLVVSAPTFLEPEVVTPGKMVAQRVQFTVMFRTLL